MSRFFAYSCDGFTFHATAEEAKAQAETLLAHERGFAIIEGEWSDDAYGIVWGEIRGHVNERWVDATECQREHVELTLEDVKQ
jgi:hypothetical protein